MEDALLSMESFSILSGAGLISASEDAPIYVHQTSRVKVEKDNEIILPDKAVWNGLDKNNPMYHANADIFVMELDDNDEMSEPCTPAVDGVTYDDANGKTIITCYSHNGTLAKDTIVWVDYYVKRTGGAQMIEITPDKFGGNYYLEASTLFRRESDGVDMPAEFIIPNCKVQSNFTFSMASSGDPSTFAFTMDAFPDYTKFDPTKKVLAAIQVIVDENEEEEGKREPCINFKQTVTSDATGATVKITNDSNSACTIKVTGDSITANVQSNIEFNANNELDGVKGMILTMNLPVEKAGRFTIKLTNPALTHYYPLDDRVSLVGSEYVKEAEYDLVPGDVLSILITDETNTAKVELSQAGKVIKTYTVSADVQFA